MSVSALDRSLAFYQDVLGLELDSRFGDVASLRTADGIEVMLHERGAVPSDTAAAAGFSVANVHAVVETWRSGGGAVVDEPARRPWGETMAVVRDADGHLVCVSGR